MSIYYAGVDICLPKTESITQTALVAWIEANLSTRDVREFLRHPYWLGEPLPPVPHSFAQVSEDQPIKLSRLWWPQWGASRWAVGHFLISERQRLAIEAAAPNGGPAKLEIQWWDQNSNLVDQITPSMYYLPPRPLQQIPFTTPAPEGQVAADLSSFYLLTLVDDRFWWNYASTTGELIITEGSTTWLQLYNTLAADLGITLLVDPINPAYLQPSPALNRHYRFVPPVLDLVAFNVGQRIVRRLDGTVLARNFPNAVADQEANLVLPSAQRGMHQAGGRMTETDVQARMPNKIQVAFPKAVNCVPTGTFYALMAAVTHAGVAKTKTFRHAALADFTLAGDATPNNQAELQALADQLATDYYGWAESDLDLKIIGIINWKIDGYGDIIEWTHGVARGSETYHRQGPTADYATLDECSTRIQCGPADWGIDLFGSSPTKLSLPFIYAGPFYFRGPWWWNGPTLQLPATVTWSANVNNYVFSTTKTYLQANVTSDMTLSGIQGYQTCGGNTDGQMIEIQNVGTKTLTITHEDTNSAVINRISTSYGLPINVPPKGMIALKYNLGFLRWFPIYSYCCGGQPVAGGKTYQVAATDTWAANQNNYAFPNATLLEVNVSAAVNLTGIAGTGTDGQMIEVQNTGNNTATLTNEDANSSAANRINTTDGNSYALKPKMTVVLKYNSAAQRWWVIGYAGTPGTVTSVSTGTGLTGGPITSSGTISLITPVVVANGGTGNTTLPAHAVLTGNGTSPTNSVAPGASGNLLTSNGTDWTSAAPATATGTFLKKTVLTVGSGTFTTGSKTNTLIVYIWGGGGGGSGAGNTAPDAAAGGGGEAGGYARKVFAVSPSTGYSYVVGAKGTGGSAGNNPGTDGADSTFTVGGTTVTAKKGKGGANATSNAVPAIAAGGASSAASTSGDVNGATVPGNYGICTGGGSNWGTGGKGGSTALGGGGTPGITAAGGNAAANTGSGGGGASAITGSNNFGGGAGADGLIVVDEFS